MRLISTATILLFAIAVLVFCLQNLDSVTVFYLGWSLSVPMAVLILLVYILGMVTGWGLLSFLRRSWGKARDKRE